MTADFALRHLGSALCLGGLVLLPFMALLLGIYLADHRATGKNSSSDDEPE